VILRSLGNGKIEKRSLHIIGINLALKTDSGKITLEKQKKAEAFLC
jgi:hypothetical protein